MTQLQRSGCIVLLAVLYLGVGVFDHTLWAPTEQAVAGVTWEMYRGGNFWVPAIDGLPYLEKPPLAYWFSWLSFVAAGHMSPGLLRLPAALAGLGAIALVYWTAARLYGERTAWLAAWLCALTANFFAIMHRASTDSVAIFSTFLCLALFMRTIPVEPGTQAAAVGGVAASRRPWIWDAAFCAALAVSFFVKNFYTYLLVVPGVAAYLLVTNQPRRLARLAIVNLLMLAALLLPWCEALNRAGGFEYLRVVFFDNTLGRFTHAVLPAGAHLGRLDDAFVVHKGASRLGDLSAVALQTLPWVIIYPPALWAFFRYRAAQPAHAFIKLAFVGMIVALMASASRVETYYRPVIFLLVLVAADYLRPLFAAVPAAPAARRARRLVAANFLVLGLLLAAAPVFIAIRFDTPSAAWWSGPELAALALLAHGTRGRWHEPRTLVRWSAVLAASWCVMLALLNPRLEALKSSRPFFASVGRELEPQTDLWTSVADDKALPEMTFYLDRRLRLLDDAGRVPELLSRRRKTAVILPLAQYEALAPRLGARARRVISAHGGRRQLVYVANYSREASGPS